MRDDTLIQVGCRGVTLGFSATILAQVRISLIASMLISGNAMLQANSERHFTASWNEPTTESKYWVKTVSKTQNKTELKRRKSNHITQIINIKQNANHKYQSDSSIC